MRMIEKDEGERIGREINGKKGYEEEYIVRREGERKIL